MGSWVAGLDIVVTRAVNGLAGHDAVADMAMIWLSAIGIQLMVLATAGQWWVRTDRTRTRHVLVAAGLSFLLGLAINQAILLFVHRVRPYDAGISHLLIAPSADYSFPSDHATASFAIAAAFLLHGMRRSGLAFLAIALLIGVSRIYIGMHYAGDVLGGFATGLFAAGLVRVVYRPDTRLDRLVVGIL